MISHLGSLIGEYGYYIIALFMFFEGIAIPFPTDTTLITASAFAARGRLSVTAIFLISTIAHSAGTTIAFLGGRRGGEFFERHSKKVNPAVLARTRNFFDRHGGVAVLIGRFVPVARMLISPLAGVSTMSLARFSVFNVIGAMIWSAVFCAVGYFFGQHPPAFGHGLVRGALVLVLGIAFIVTVLVAGGWLVEESDAAWRAEGTFIHAVLTTPPLRWLASHSPRARAFLFRRFTPGDYLGLNLTLGLGLSFVSLVIFSAISNAVLSRDEAPRFDLQLSRALRETITPARLEFWHSVAQLGRLPLVAAAGVVLALVLLRRRRTWLPLIGLVASIAGSLVLDALVSHMFANRASLALANDVTNFGVPSGQALGSLVGYGIMAYFLILLVANERGRIAIATMAVMLVAAVCFARLYTGERLFSDIVSGLAAGGVWLSACLTGLEVARRRALVSPQFEDDLRGGARVR